MKNYTSLFKTGLVLLSSFVLTATSYSATVAITTPTDGETFASGSTAPVAVVATGDIQKINLMVDGAWHSSDSTAPYDFNLTEPDGNYALTARLKFNGGGYQDSTAVNIAFGGVGGSPSFTSPSDGSLHPSGPVSVVVDVPSGDILRVNLRVDGSYEDADFSAPYTDLVVDEPDGTYEIDAIVKYNDSTPDFYIPSMTITIGNPFQTLKEYVVGLPQNDNIGRTSTQPLKVPGVDTLPAGSGLSGILINVNADNVVFEDWDFDGFILNVKANNCTITNCIIGEYSAPVNKPAAINIYGGGNDCLIEHNDFLGYAGEGGLSQMIFHRTTGSGMTISAAQNLVIRLNKFEHTNSDAIKIAGEGAVVEWNAFLDPVNINSVPSAWSSTTTYNIGEYATNAKGHLFLSLINGNVDNAVPIKKQDNAYWENLDPHVDHITVTAAPGGLAIQYNYFSRADQSRQVQGMNNVVRFVRNSGNNHLVEDCLYLANYIEPNSLCTSKALQVSDGGLPNYLGPVELRHSWFGEDSKGKYYYDPIAIDDCIWDSNVDSTDNTAISLPTGCTAETTSAPDVSTVVPLAIVNGYQ